MFFPGDEQVIVIPDLMRPYEALYGIEEDFEEFFHGSPYLRDPYTWRNTVSRRTVEEPYAYGNTAVRQVVAQVMVFVIPDDVYANARLYGKSDNHDYFVLNRVQEEATLFATTKLKAGSEARLHGKLAAAFGGHAELQDTRHIELLDRPSRIHQLARTTAFRELNEELSIEDLVGDYVSQHLVPLGIINSAAGDMESVHIGFIFLLAVPTNMALTIKETEKLQAVSIPLRELRNVVASGLVREGEGYAQASLDHWTRLMFLHPKAALAHAIALSARG